MKLKFPPANRIVAFAGPYISLASGALATWLIVHVQVLGSLHLGQDKLAHGIAYAVTAGLGALLPHLGMQKWLNGHQAYFKQVFNFVEMLDPGVQKQIAQALPEVNGDILAALTQAIGPKSVPAGGAAEAGESGDIEKPNSLIDVTAPPLDELPPPESFGDDVVHAPPGTPGAERKPAAPAGAPGAAASEGSQQ